MDKGGPADLVVSALPEAGLLRGPVPPPGVTDLREDYNAVVDLLDRPVAEGRRAGPALLTPPPEPSELSYADLADQVSRAGMVLGESGARREDRVALYADDSPAWVAAFLGAVRAGLVAVPLNTMVTPDETLSSLAIARPRVLLADGPRRTVIEPLLDRLPVRPRVITLDDPGPDGWSAAVQAAGRSSAADTLADEPALILFTSGTTGRSKGAVHAQRDLAVGRCFTALMGYGPHDRLWSTSKLFFAFALGSTVSSGLAAGASIVLHADRVTPERIAEVVGASRPTVLSSVPTLYARLVHAALDPSAFSSLRAAVSAGESLPADVARRFSERFGVEILEHIGCTEYIHPFAAIPPGAAKPGSVGPVMPGVEAAILVEGELARTGQFGDLWIRGPGVMDGYLHRRAATASTMAGGWLRTGDVARADEDGYLTMQGRSDEMMKVGGIKVSPVEVEAVLFDHPAVREVAVAGVPDPDHLVQPWAFVVPVPGTTTSDGLVAELQRWVKERMPRYAYPRRVVFVDDLPRTATGKVQRFRLINQVAQQGLDTGPA